MYNESASVMSIHKWQHQKPTLTDPQVLTAFFRHLMIDLALACQFD